jgi:hypothetical protein
MKAYHAVAHGQSNDDGLLFVAFSYDALEEANGAAPFHSDLKSFVEALEESSFNEFFDARFAWHWYPIVTRGFSSFPAHGDLPGELDKPRLLNAIGWSAAICAREEGKRFVSALGLLSLLCRSLDRPEPVAALSRHFMSIRERVTRNAIDRNIHYWFSRVAFYQWRTGEVPDGYGGTFDRAGLNAPESEKND